MLEGHVTSPGLSEGTGTIFTVGCFGAFVLFILVLISCLWRRKATVTEPRDRTPSPHNENLEYDSSITVETPSPTENVESVEMHHKKEQKRHKTYLEPVSEEPRQNSKGIFKMFRPGRSKYDDVEPAPEYLSSRRDTVQHERQWQRKYSAQWHDFVENELCHLPPQIKANSQVILVENQA